MVMLRADRHTERHDETKMVFDFFEACIELCEIYSDI